MLDQAPTIHEIAAQLATVLSEAAAALRTLDLPDSATRLDQLAAQLYEPCVVAVVGKVSSGKSTFVNTLLQEPLAKVGASEVTATITRFAYGEPVDPARPVLCVWRDGQRTAEPIDFLERVQGHDTATLRMASAIGALEYRTRHQWLEAITLVDTPGTHSVNQEHQDATAELLQLREQLREQRTRETREMCERADAVIYMLRSTANVDDAELLRDFQEANGQKAQAFNAIGILPKIDQNEEILAKRQYLADSAAHLLREHLSTVLPISAGIQQEIDRFNANLDRWRTFVAQIRAIPPDIMIEDMLVGGESYFLDAEAEWSLTVEERQQLLGGREWATFRTLAQVVCRCDSAEEALAALRDLAGFDQLREILDSYFVRRGKLLRWHRIINDVQQTILFPLRYTHLVRLRARDAEERARRERYLRFLQRHRASDPALVAELTAFLEVSLQSTVMRLEDVIARLDRDLDACAIQVSALSDGFTGLQLLLRHHEQFADAELLELRRLFGMLGEREVGDEHLPGDGLEHLMNRVSFWDRQERFDATGSRQQIAGYAAREYKRLLRASMAAHKA